MADNKCTAHIYLVTNTANGKQYVGQTRLSLSRRWLAHCNSALDSKRTFCRVFYAAIRKYGRQAFVVEPIREMAGSTQAEIDEAERLAITAYGTLSPNGYNLLSSRGGRGSMHEETKELIRAVHLGKPKPPEWREAIRRANTGKVHGPDRIAKMRAGRWSKPYKHSAETKAKISAVLKGRPQHPNQVEALRSYHLRRRSEVEGQLF